MLANVEKVESRITQEVFLKQKKIINIFYASCLNKRYEIGTFEKYFIFLPYLVALLMKTKLLLYKKTLNSIFNLPRKHYTA